MLTSAGVARGVGRRGALPHTNWIPRGQEKNKKTGEIKTKTIVPLTRASPLPSREFLSCINSSPVLSKEIRINKRLGDLDTSLFTIIAK